MPLLIFGSTLTKHLSLLEPPPLPPKAISKMKLLIGFLMMACFAAAQSPHVFRPMNRHPGPKGKFEGGVVEFSIGGRTIKEDTEGIANRTLFNRLKKRVDPLNPTPDEQSEPRPMFQNPQCMQCPDQSNLKTADGILSQYTTDYFLRAKLGM
jgi:hypothetical protein